MNPTVKMTRLATTFVLAALTAGVIMPAAVDAAKKVTYEALADGSGIFIEMSPEGGDTQGAGGGVTDARVTHKPLAEATGSGIVGDDGATRSASAPPDENPSANGEPFAPVGAADVLQLTSDGGSGDAAAEAEDGSPSSTSTATFGPSTITAGPDNPIASGFTVTIGSISTTSLAKGKGTNVSSEATSKKVTITMSVAATVLAAANEASMLCQTLTGLNADLGAACTAAVDDEGSVPYASIEVSANNAACTWDGEAFDATGEGSSITPTILGVPLTTIEPGQPPQTIGDATPLEMQLGAGGFGKEERDDGIDGIGGAAFISLFGGQGGIRFSASSCSLGAALPGDEVKALAVTGSVVLWYLLGGAVMVAGALGLRRFLHRPA